MGRRYAGLLIIHDRETHAEFYGEPAIGDVLEAIRGNGPREGDHMGKATVTGFFEDGSPDIAVELFG